MPKILAARVPTPSHRAREERSKLATGGKFAPKTRTRARSAPRPARHRPQLCPRRRRQVHSPRPRQHLGRAPETAPPGLGASLQRLTTGGLWRRRPCAHVREAAVPSPGRRPWGGGTMPLYIALVSYTDRGMQAVRDSPRRLDQAKAQLAEMGGRFQAVYMT